jgi:hypothetical protein
VQPPSIDPLIAELKAIELWDHFYEPPRTPAPRSCWHGKLDAKDKRQFTNNSWP